MDQLQQKLQSLANRLCYVSGLAAHYSRWRDWDSVIIVHPHGDWQINYYVTSENPDQLVLGNLSVRPQMRRCKLATKLLSMAEYNAKSLEMTSILLGVDKDAPKWLMEWYSRLGYEFHSLDEDGDTLLIKQLN